ncbi:MAG: hypothetical protein M3Y82_06270 [Verrucomicrobiota bacterium]|nr:hypothetical protein [Verrucomicrobiota bacterium]
MNRLQFILLNTVSFFVVIILVTHFFIVRANNELSGAVARNQAAISNARQLEPILDQLAKRIARGSEADPRLRNILVKHGLTVTLDVDGKKKTYP